MFDTARIVFVLALSSMAVGCSGPPTCVGERRLIMLPDAELCGVTASGLVLLAEHESHDLVLSRLGTDGSLSEFTRIPSGGASCGQVVHEPGDPDIWVVENGVFGSISPDRLHRIDLDGTLIGSTTLEHEGALIRAYGFTTHAGQQCLAGRADTYDPDGGLHDIINSELVVQCRDHDDVIWTQLGYSGHSPDPDAAGLALDVAWDLVWSDAGLSFITYKSWTDSASVALFTVDEQDGAPRSTALLTGDDYGGPTFQLSSDRDRRIYVGAMHLARRAIEELDIPATPARTIVTARTNADTIEWSTETEWPDFFGSTMTAVVPAAGRLYHAVSGSVPETGYPWHTHLARYTEDGVLDCSEELGELEGMAVGSLGFAGQGRLVLKAWQVLEDPWDPGEQAMLVMWTD
jgi:hypothetical protein